jgi:CRISPR/Cas system CMR subunit Cmr4 (Cas7 group RAMP superfamily)
MSGLYIARITIEALSPLSVGSGEAGVSDVSLIRDANGLPMIAGSSLQGLMKALAMRDNALGLCLLGDDDHPGRIQFSDARIHDADNRAVTGLMLEGVTDSLLEEYLADEPLKRDHVKIDHRGAGDNASFGKFDRSALPRGTRFSFELTMWEKDESDKDADRLGFLSVLALVRHPLFRPGGATRRGYGKVKVRCGGWNFWQQPVQSVSEISALRALPYSDLKILAEILPEAASSDLHRYTLKLKSSSWWRAGSDGERVRTKKYENESPDNRLDHTDLAFTREPKICWDAGSNLKGWQKPGESIAEDYVLAGSSIRGALWHRTLFHWNRQNGRLFNADAPNASVFETACEAPPPLLALFGEQKEGDEGQKSALIVEDLVFRPEAVTAADHLKIDRFTGGATTGALFSEELVCTGSQELAVEMIIDAKLLDDRLKKLGSSYRVANVLAAFKAAVDDLCTGRLALGAKSSGFFTGNCEEGGAI